MIITACITQFYRTEIASVALHSRETYIKVAFPRARIKAALTVKIMAQSLTSKKETIGLRMGLASKMA